MPHSIVYIGSELHVRHVVAGISELGNTALCIELRTRRQHVGAHSVRLQTARERSCRQSGHEVRQMQTLCRQRCVVSHAASVDRSLAAHMSASLSHIEVGSIAWSVGMHIGFKPNAVWYVERACHRAWQHRFDEVEIICTSLSLDVGTQTVGIREILRLALSL